MAKGLNRSIARGSKLRQPMIKKTIAIRNASIIVAGATGVGFGSVVIGGLPEGNLLLLGAVANLQFRGPTSADLADNWQGDFAIGSTPASDGTVTGTDANIIASTALAAATLELSPVTRGVGAGSLINFTAAAAALSLNLLIDDANIGANDLALLASGELYIAYTMLGDD